ncbi:MAG: hypothetical protein R3D02_16640 [Hyphomicrobiales bacterium]
MADTIACVACLDPARSVHTPTFIRAVEIARDLVAGPAFELRFFDDRAEAGVAAKVSGEIAALLPRAVVGHFASAAAAAAIPAYEAAGIPLLLPAATMARLTEHGNVIRVCDSDDDYADWLTGELAGRRFIVERLHSDGSAHGESVVAALGRRQHGLGGSGTRATVFSGSYRASVDFASGFSGGTLVLTDDADAASLAGDLAAAGVNLSRTAVLVAALRPRPSGLRAAAIAEEYRRRHQSMPGCYFWETIAAIEIACDPSFPTGPRFETVLGALSPGRRECRPGSFSLEGSGDEHGAACPRFCQRRCGAPARCEPRSAIAAGFLDARALRLGRPVRSRHSIRRQRAAVRRPFAGLGVQPPNQRTAGCSSSMAAGSSITTRRSLRRSSRNLPPPAACGSRPSTIQRRRRPRRGNRFSAP